MERSGYYKDNPVSVIFESGDWVHCRLDDPTGELEYPVLRDLRDCGGTDYIALPLEFRGTRYQAVAFTSDVPSGFTPEHVALLEALLPSLSSTVEILVSYGQMERVLATYVGLRASEVILSGVIQRGQVQTIRAVIWVSDLRSFTTISEALRPSELITLLDDYFDCLVEPIAKCGGEVLKFMGDSVLAIFPLLPNADQRTVCCAAARAAREAIEAIDRLNGRWRHLVAEPLSGGIALHIGDVSYGNIGSVDRLDFTAIGPAVNLASRLERVTRNIPRRIVVSEPFADILGSPAESIGHFRLPGITAVQHVFSFPQSLPGEAESIRETDF
jgi:adenylate cyclase